MNIYIYVNVHKYIVLFYFLQIINKSFMLIA